MVPVEMGTDIAYTLRYAGRIDWDALVHRSRQTGCHRMLLVGLGLASSLLGSVIPSAIEKQIRTDPSTLSLIDQIQSALLDSAPIDNAQELIYCLRARERFRDHVVLVWRLLPRIFRLTLEDGLSDRNPAPNKLAALIEEACPIVQNLRPGMDETCFSIPLIPASLRLNVEIQDSSHCRFVFAADTCVVRRDFPRVLFR